MKFYYKIIVLVLFVLYNASCSTDRVYAQGPEVSFQVFFDNLSLYGFWTLHPDYGYVWVPDAGPDFVPYLTDGHWVLTNYGWTWMSYYDWGWAPFHYGRWDWNEVYGWFWVPGNEWGPSWVVWRRANGYYGWAPMAPGVSINVSVGIYRDRPERWVFVRDRDIVRRDINQYYVNRTEYVTLINNSTIINQTYVDNRRNTTYIYGPRPEEVQRVSGRRISPLKVEDTRRPGSSIAEDRIEIYRPNVRRVSSGSEKPAPSRVVDVNELRRRSNATGTTKQDQRQIQSPQRRNEVRKDQDVNIPNSSRRGERPQPYDQRQQKAPDKPQQTTPPDKTMRREQPSMPTQQPTPSEQKRSVPESERRNAPQTPSQTAPQPQSSEPSQRGTQRSQPERAPQTQPSNQQPSSTPSNRRQESKPSSNERHDEGTQGSGARRR